MNFKKGFTLIELLVVIAIIAILAAILFPVFAQAREKARASSCLSNCKQFGTAEQLYMDDYDETYAPNYLFDSDITVDLTSDTYKGYPSRRYFATDHTEWANSMNKCWSWEDSLFPYVKNINVYQCPSKKDACGYGMNAQFKNNYYGENISSYTLYNTYTPLCSSQIKSPSQLVLIGDTTVYDSSTTSLDGSKTYKNVSSLAPFCYNRYFVDTYGPKVSSEDKTGRKHNNGANFTFADGHAKFYKLGQGPLEGVTGSEKIWLTSSPWWNVNAQ